MKKSILIIDDDRAIQGVLRTLLEIEGFQVYIPQPDFDLENIFFIVSENKPDFIILDVHLRAVNGIDVLKKIRAESFHQPKILMVSGMDVRETCLSAGADKFLLKPYMPEDMLKYLHSQVL